MKISRSRLTLFLWASATGLGTLPYLSASDAQESHASLQQEIAQVEQQVDSIEADAVAMIASLPSTGPHKPAALGKVHEACAFCHMPQIGFQAAIESLNVGQSHSPGRSELGSACVSRQAPPTPRSRHPCTSRASPIEIWSAAISGTCARPGCGCKTPPPCSLRSGGGGPREAWWGGGKAAAPIEVIAVGMPAGAILGTDAAASPLHRPSAGPPPPLRGGGQAPRPKMCECGRPCRRKDHRSTRRRWPIPTRPASSIGSPRDPIRTFSYAYGDRTHLMSHGRRTPKSCAAGQTILLIPPLGLKSPMKRACLTSST